MTHANIIIRNAHTNNLKNIDIEIPKHKVVVFTGASFLFSFNHPQGMCPH